MCTLCRCDPSLGLYLVSGSPRALQESERGGRSMDDPWTPGEALPQTGMEFPVLEIV